MIVSSFVVGIITIIANYFPPLALLESKWSHDQRVIIPKKKHRNIIIVFLYVFVYAKLFRVISQHPRRCLKLARAFMFIAGPQCGKVLEITHIFTSRRGWRTRHAIEAAIATCEKFHIDLLIILFSSYHSSFCCWAATLGFVMWGCCVWISAKSEFIATWWRLWWEREEIGS